MSRLTMAYSCANPSGPRTSTQPTDTALTERYLQQLSQLPLTVDPSSPPHERVAEQLAAAMRILRDEPRLAAACTRSLLSADDPVAEVRSRIGSEIHRRVTAALGTGAWPEVVTTLETMFWGMLIQAHTQSMDYATTAARLDTMVSLVLTD
ncbi:hypothetical protein ABIA30_000002 [Mycobacterium sp. MAA66]|uniref:TetR family transcriptional regulator n=1 Tax=Mycobacterium sp. MAA66 TaxID=3156297 RepID=UPI00351624D1